jgi:hypothetical protein
MRGQQTHSGKTKVSQCRFNNIVGPGEYDVFQPNGRKFKKIHGGHQANAVFVWALFYIPTLTKNPVMQKLTEVNMVPPYKTLASRVGYCP